MIRATICWLLLSRHPMPHTNTTGRWNIQRMWRPDPSTIQCVPISGHLIPLPFFYRRMQAQLISAPCSPISTDLTGCFCVHHRLSPGKWRIALCGQFAGRLIFSVTLELRLGPKFVFVASFSSSSFSVSSLGETIIHLLSPPHSCLVIAGMSQGRLLYL